MGWASLPSRDPFSPGEQGTLPNRSLEEGIGHAQLSLLVRSVPQEPHALPCTLVLGGGSSNRPVGVHQWQRQSEQGRALWRVLSQTPQQVQTEQTFLLLCIRYPGLSIVSKFGRWREKRGALCTGQLRPPTPTITVFWYSLFRGYWTGMFSPSCWKLNGSNPITGYGGRP